MEENLFDLKDMITELNEVSKVAGLSINMNKTKIITNIKEKIKIEIDGQRMEYVDEIIYLDQKVEFGNMTKGDRKS